MLEIPHTCSSVLRYYLELLNLKENLHLASRHISLFHTQI